MHTRTPPEITKHVTRLVHRVTADGTPLYLDVVPEPGAKIDECFQNVHEKISRCDGSIVHGWQIWEWAHVLVEAEFHAVWQSPTGELVEITPKRDGEQRILFVPDPHNEYRGVRIDNVRVPLREDQLVLDFITVSEEVFKVMNRGDRAKMHGNISISIPAHEIEPLLQLKNLILLMLSEGLRAHNQCVCGSGRKYKRCHGRVFQV